MDEGTLTGALDRIEAALGRLETSAAQIGAQPDPASDAGLVVRHDALRSSVETALARIDALLAEQPE